jgi:hypothetical protein
MTMNSSQPPFVERSLDLRTLLARKSHFLFGPRQTGKTSLVRYTLEGVRSYDLLDSSVYLSLSREPHRLGQELTARDRLVVIDEIQRLPILLNEVHRLIEERGLRFLLTTVPAGGCGRRATWANRARKAVTSRIRDTITRIAKEHPSLGRHLENAIRTGVFCSYRPDRSPEWKV